MKRRYNTIIIKFKIAKKESIEDLFTYKTLIRSFRELEDLGVIEVQTLDINRKDSCDPCNLYSNKLFNEIY